MLKIPCKNIKRWSTQGILENGEVEEENHLQK
jgi:hypothetical protein